MRLTISDNTYNKLLLLSIKNNDRDLINELKESRLKYLSSLTSKKKKATNKAIAAKKKKSKERVQNAIALLNFENRKINANSISKTSGVHYNTAKKYLEILKNENLFM